MKKFISSKKIDDSYLYPVYGHYKTKKVKQNTNKETYIYTDESLLKDHYKNQYLTFEALEDGEFGWEGGNPIQYSLDNGQTWNELHNYKKIFYYDEITNTIIDQWGDVIPEIIKKGTKILWKSNINKNIGEDINLDDAILSIGYFYSSGKYNVYGNIMSLLYLDDFNNKEDLKNLNFNILFRKNKIINAKNLILPSKILNNNCYRSMFSHCTLLVTAPELPATTLAYSCYRYMFSYCTLLTTAPTLPATTLANYCYSQMFEGCSSLITAPELLSIDIESINECYSYMFFNCIKLKYIKCLAQLENNYNISNIIPSSLYNWLYHVSTNGTFIKKRGVEFPIGSSGIPQGWKIIEVD